jgi:hypothetical protein
MLLKPPNGLRYRQGGELAEKTQIIDSAFGAASARARAKPPTCPGARGVRQPKSLTKRLALAYIELGEHMPRIQPVLAEASDLP